MLLTRSEWWLSAAAPVCPSPQLHRRIPVILSGKLGDCQAKTYKIVDRLEGCTALSLVTIAQAARRLPALPDVAADPLNTHSIIEYYVSDMAQKSSPVESSDVFVIRRLSVARSWPGGFASGSHSLER